MNEDKFKLWSGLGAGLILIGLILGLIFHPWSIIGAGEKGVLLEWGAVMPGTIDEGWEWRVPLMQNIKKMDVKIQKITTQESAASKDLQTVTTQVVLNYRLNPDKVDTIYKTFRKDYESRVIIPAIQESVKATTALFNAEELITQRPTVKAQIKETLSAKLLEYDMVLVDLSITDIQFSEVYTLAIESKQVIEQETQKAQLVLDMRRIEAKQIVVIADANKNKTILEADAKAYALKAQKQEITPELNKYKAIEKWDGVMPKFMGTGIMPFVEVGAAELQATAEGE